MGIFDYAYHSAFLASLPEIAELILVDEGIGQQMFVDNMLREIERNPQLWNSIMEKCGRLMFFSYLPLEHVEKLSATLVPNRFIALRDEVRRWNLDPDSAALIGPVPEGRDIEASIRQAVIRLRENGARDICYYAHRSDLLQGIGGYMAKICQEQQIRMDFWEMGFEDWLTSTGSLPRVIASYASTISIVACALDLKCKNIILKSEYAPHIKEALLHAMNLGGTLEFEDHIF
jgi:hypothetical protein